MRGETNFKGSDSSDPTVYSLYCAHAPSHESIRKWFAHSGFRDVSSSISNKHCGTAVLVRDSLKVTKVITDNAGRFVQALVDFGEDQLSFISLYAPNRNPERNAFFANLTGLVDLTRPVFVAGDFNSALDNLLDRKRRFFTIFYSNLSFVAYHASWTHFLLLVACVGYVCVAYRHDLGADVF